MQPSGRIACRAPTGAATSVTMLLLLLLVAGPASAQMQPQAQRPLWNEAVGDNNNLMAMFAPPQQQQPQQAAGPSVLQQWQQQQTMGGQPQAAAGAPDAGAALIAQLAALLQGAGAAQQQPLQQQQFPMQAQQPGPQAARLQRRNLYGSRRQRPAAASAAGPVGDTSLLSTSASPVRPSAGAAVDPILPLSHGSGYGFSRPPADVAARRRARMPKPVDQLDVLGRISRRAAPGSKPRQRNRWINLEQQFKQAPRRDVRTRSRKQRKHNLLRARKPGRRQAADSKAVKQVLQSNPFLAKLNAQQQQKAKAKSKQAAAAPAVALAAEDDFANSPAMIAFKQAARSALSAAEADDLALVEMSAGAGATVASTTAAPTDPVAEAEAEAETGTEQESLAESGEFAQAAVPSADFHKMFRSIMKSHRNNNRRRNKGGRPLQH